jgi:Tlde1 domain
MTDAVAAYYGLRSRGRPAFSFRRLAAQLANHVVLAAAAVISVGLAIVSVLLAAAWLVSTTVSTKTADRAPAHFTLRSIALVPRYPGSVQTAKAADIVVFPPSLAQREAPPVRVAKVTSVPLPPLPTHSPIEPPTHVSSPVQDARMQDTVHVPMPPSPPVRIAKTVPPIKVALLPAAPATPPVAKSAPRTKIASLPAPPPAPVVRAAPVPEADKAAATHAPGGRTAVYDIAAHVVILPDGEKLEAHSGLGHWRDNPRYVNVKDRGPTPPNIYELSLRGELFHGVRAIRLTPVDEDKMFGRAGMLAHTYMLGPDGDSNGCVSFKDYHAFLQAYLKGDVDRLVVVPGHGSAVASVTPTYPNMAVQMAALNH